MNEKDLLTKLINELKSAASEYQTEAAKKDAQPNNPLLTTLVRRCERFETEIESALAAQADSDGAQTDIELLQEKETGKDIFALIEERESRLERLYREMLRCRRLPPKVRPVLENHLRLVSKWHNFIIIEEADFILNGEVKIPDDFDEERKSYSAEKRENRKYAK